MECERAELKVVGVHGGISSWTLVFSLSAAALSDSIEATRDKLNGE